MGWKVEVISDRPLAVSEIERGDVSLDGCNGDHSDRTDLLRRPTRSQPNPTPPIQISIYKISQPAQLSAST